MHFSIVCLALATQQPLPGQQQACPTGDPGAQPNILIILADDIGTDLLGSYEPFYPGTPTSPAPTPTPAIDWLAEGGMLFTDCWTSPVCSPTRAQILTGRYSQRTGVGGILTGTSTEPGLQLTEATLPQLLRNHPRPYAAAGVGKWHLARTNDVVDWSHPLGPPANPWFDRWAGSLFNLRLGQGTSYNEWEKTFATPIDPSMDECVAAPGAPCQLLLDFSTSNAPAPGEYATVDTVDDAVHLIGTLPEPWFLYVAFNAPHIPLTPPSVPLTTNVCQGFATEPICGLTGGTKPEDTRCMVQWMDNELGRLLCDVDTEGLGERTLILFMGDNGTVGDRVNGAGTLLPGAIVAPFAVDHGKGTVYQGGVNVPLIARGPGIAQGVSHELISSTDLLATVAELAGMPHPNQLAEDSISFVPSLALGACDGPLRQTVFVESFNENFVPVAGGPPAGYQPTRHWRAIRNADFKLIRREEPGPGGVLMIEEEFYDLRRPFPGGVQADPFEQNNLRPQIIPGGPSRPEKAYDALLAEMQADHPSLFRPGPAALAAGTNDTLLSPVPVPERGATGQMAGPAIR